MRSLARDLKFSMDETGRPRSRFINVEEGIERVGGNRELFFKLLRRFADEYADSVQVILDLIKQDNLVEAENQCHGLKGVAGNLSMVDLFESAKEIDDDLKKGLVPSSDRLELFASRLAYTIEETNQLHPL